MTDKKRVFRERDRAHIAAVRKRVDQHPPIIDARVSRSGSAVLWGVDSPYEDADGWVTLLADAFGTNSRDTVETFIRQLTELTDSHYDEDKKRYEPDHAALSAMISIVQALKPENAAEAAMAAQMCAVHLATMQNAFYAAKGSERSAATLSRLSRTYAKQMETFAMLRGKGRHTEQKISVSKHVHHHQHVHVEGGVQDFGEQPDGKNGPTHLPQIDGSCPRVATVRSKDTGGDTLQERSNAGEETLPASRRQKSRRTEG